MADINPLLEKKFLSPGPKRILSLDGGGIRGALTLGYLEKIESILKDRHRHLYKDPDDFRLCHYFDLIGGTSTGAIIATALAIGMSASEVKEKYKTLGREIFAQKKYKAFTINLGFWKKTFILFTNYKYDAAPLANNLKILFGDSVLGDESNKTGLCIVAKRFDTFSTWPITNNPNARYFSQNRFLLRNIVRASAAAPTYFKPEAMDVGSGQVAAFVDGGMSLMNNPSFQLFLISALQGYNIAGKTKTWKQGVDDLFIVSVGTGRKPKKLDASQWLNPNLAKLAPQVSEQFMNDANEMVEMIMQLHGKMLPKNKYREIDREMGVLETDCINGCKSFTYVRYNVELVKNKLNEIGITNWTDEEIDSLSQMDNANNVDKLIEVGTKSAASITADDFPSIFDIKELYL